MRSLDKKHFLMCRPDYFDVAYAINPWMNPDENVDRDLAISQWERLRVTYEDFGHDVSLIEAQPGLPDMVFTANAGIVRGGRALIGRFLHEQRADESGAFATWLTGRYDDVATSSEVNEGEGDFLAVAGKILAASGFRSSAKSHDEVRKYFSAPVISLELVDPRYYHLDTALCVLDDSTIAYYPGAFNARSRQLLQEVFPHAIVAATSDAEVLGLNAVSDGHNVFLTDQAAGMHRSLRAHGYNPVGVDLSELLRAGGSVKCCTLEIHP